MPEGPSRQGGRVWNSERGLRTVKWGEEKEDITTEDTEFTEHTEEKVGGKFLLTTETVRVPREKKNRL